MYAIFEDGSHQYRVGEGDVVTLDRKAGEPGAEVVFNNVLLMAYGEQATVGRPLIEGAKVIGTIVRQFRDKKIIIQKFRRRKNMRRRRGHRQPFTNIKVTRIAVDV
ncbi:MAG: 50S ribosomal protein L21 [Isosphaeraceae bacterium]